MSNSFENSSEYDDWIEETGGSDESYRYYYEKWERRIRIQNNQDQYG